MYVDRYTPQFSQYSNFNLNPIAAIQCASILSIAPMTPKVLVLLNVRYRTPLVQQVKITVLDPVHFPQQRVEFKFVECRA